MFIAYKYEGRYVNWSEKSFHYCLGDIPTLLHKPLLLDVKVSIGLDSECNGYNYITIKDCEVVGFEQTEYRHALYSHQYITIGSMET